MGCKWSSNSEFHEYPEDLEIDPIEEHLHLKTWKDPANRLRIHKSEHAQAASSTLDKSRFLETFLNDDTSHKPPPATRDEQAHNEHKNVPREDANPDGPISTQTVKPDDADKIYLNQDSRRKAYLRSLDPECWLELVKQGYFQKAEDLISEASELELKENDESLRYGRFVHSLGAIYDYRSNIDVTGQQQYLSLKSAKYAQRASMVFRQLLASVTSESMRARLEDYLASSLLMQGKSLCNTSLDGDIEDLTCADAFTMAEQSIKEAKDLRKKLQHKQLPEAIMAVGYVHYCRAGCILSGKSKHDRTVAQLEAEYLNALESYQESLDHYLMGAGEEHTDSIRMRCNIALVYNVMSRIPCEKSLEYLEEAEKQYCKVLALQESLFGRRHQRTQRIQQDLKGVRERLSKLRSERDPGPVNPHSTESGSHQDSDSLLEEFLLARRLERSIEKQVQAR
mmetsp:Transcript_39820/g.125086  ORF Transcript_39820/g.125086 Transcript_39820/m.125086 type:complete len:453 (-) Transcript_39820:83-1441(-)